MILSVAGIAIHVVMERAPSQPSGIGQALPGVNWFRRWEDPSVRRAGLDRWDRGAANRTIVCSRRGEREPGGDRGGVLTQIEPWYWLQSDSMPWPVSC
jgi:hypothetical protein